MNYLVRILNAILDNEVSIFFAVLISIIFILSVLSRIPYFNKSLATLDRSGAALMTTLGVLGTFTGIFIGLLDFNVADIDSSVPKLLAGLKIAFSTSIVGMGSAIVFKLIQALTPQPLTDDAEATPEDILKSLRSIDESVDRSSEAQKAALDDVRQAISSDRDSSLLTQIQKLRMSIHDGQQELIEEFRQFAKTMAEDNSKALIQALEQVIRDFNTQLNEQFGENFKQLNEAVGALLTWQENYRSHVETLETRIDAAVEALESSGTAIEEIASQTEGIPETLKPLEKILPALQGTITNLEGHLEAVANLKDQAMEAFPVIEENLQKVTDGFGKAVSAVVENMESSVEDHRQALDQLRNGYEDLRNAANEARTTFADSLNEALEGMRATLEKAMEGHAQSIEATSDELQRQIRDAWVKTQDAINEQFTTLDEQMQQELNRSIEALGRNLASLSEKFVSDYEPLTNRLREVIRIAEGAS